MKLFKPMLLLILCLAMTVISGSIYPFALSNDEWEVNPDQDRDLNEVQELNEVQDLNEIQDLNKVQDEQEEQLPKYTDNWTFVMVETTVDSKRALEFVGNDGNKTTICTTDEDAMRVVKYKVLSDGTVWGYFESAEDAYRIGIEYIPHTISDIFYHEYMSDGTRRSYQVHPDDEDAKVMHTGFVVTETPDNYAMP